MRRFLWLCLLCPGLAFAQPSQLIAVKAWRGSFTARTHTTEKDLIKAGVPIPEGLHAEFSEDITVEFLLDQFVDDPEVWSGKITHSNLSAHHSDSMISSDVQITGRFSTGGPLDLENRPDQAVLEFHRDTGWSMSMRSCQREITVHQETVMKGFRGEENQKSEVRGPWDIPIQPYPKEGYFLTFKGVVGAEITNSSLVAVNFAPDFDVEVHLWPDGMEELKLEIDDSLDYQEWRPTATESGDHGTPLSLTARVVSSTGLQPHVRVEKFVWELDKTSREPGIALNFPLNATDTRFDLDLDAKGELVTVAPDKQRVERLVSEGFEDSIQVLPFDWGGWSTLKVTAYLSDGKKLEGKLKGSKEPNVRLPRRNADTLIADVWRKNVTGKDNSDAEKTPEGDKVPGDGLTLYEEYRGFYENHTHIEGDPKVKDLFIMNLSGGTLLRGIAKFKRLSKLAVHHKLQESELPESRVINANHREAPHIVDQHGLAIYVDPTSTGGWSFAEGGPGNPGKVSLVHIFKEAGAANQDKLMLSSIVAHELFHSVNVWHHGDLDGWAIVYVLGPEYLHIGHEGKGDGASSRVFGETLGELTASWRADLNAPNKNPRHYMLWLGEEHGQHSGVENCVMRYFVSQLYLDTTSHQTSDPSIRFYRYVGEDRGDALCDTRTGDGVNKAGRDPQSRYGDASANRGDCVSQIHVTDAVPAATR